MTRSTGRVFVLAIVTLLGAMSTWGSVLPAQVVVDVTATQAIAALGDAPPAGTIAPGLLAPTGT